MVEREIKRGDEVRAHGRTFVVLVPPGGEGYISRFLLADRLPTDEVLKDFRKASSFPGNSSRELLEIDELEP